jgi:hypothetical protein
MMRRLACATALAAMAGCGNGDKMATSDLSFADLAVGDDLSTAAPDDMSVPIDLTVGRDLMLPACSDFDAGAPSELRCSGLYDDWASRHVDPANLPFKPGFELWSDGAQKSRWIFLPAGKKIDVSDMNEWKFPVGTKIWKEFRLDFGGTMKKVETRLIAKLADGSWDMQTYVWSADQSTATLQTTPIAPFPGTTFYEVPAGKCATCHANRVDRVLGFEAVLLAAPEATGLTWTQLQTTGRLTATNGNDAIAASALHILDGTGRPAERNAVGYLHVNCGTMCHKPGGLGPFSMRLTVDNTAKKTPDGVSTTDVYLGAINVASGFIPGGGTGNYYRLRPTDATHSVIDYRMGQRDPLTGGNLQMPPLDTHVVDTVGLQSIDAWITFMTTANGYPAPSP